ncbi:MAG: bifunctional metallophosphatase/5'-nucleotidase [Erysipelothrix sp.]|nr:bifunctional metallophosphatase/5'-nucleotidase [Erysipelothrix sp.]
MEKDPITKEVTERLTGENQAYKMCDIKGLDILITGHQHRSLIEKINGVLVTQSTFKAKEFVEIEINLKTNNINAKIISSKNLKEDKKIIDSLKDLQEKTQIWLDQPVGKIIDYDLKIEDEFQARLNKHPIISFLNQVQLEVSGADISATSLFNNTTGFNQEITMRDLVNTYIFPNTLVVKEISGKALKAALEVSVSYFDLDKDNQIKVSKSFVKPKPQHYNYDMYDGIEYTAKISNPVGQRIISLTFKGRQVKDDDIYTLVVNNYRAVGAGNYDMISDAKLVKEINVEITEILRKYLSENSPVKIQHKNNIIIIP